MSARLGKEFDSISIFCCGSLGRGDVGAISDMDLFIFSDQTAEDIKRLSEINLFHELISLNNEMEFPEFSNDGMFLKVHSFPDMEEAIGSPKDDHDNLFTTRMLMLLESKPVFNASLYEKQIKKIADIYFRDAKGKSRIKPLFLLNDILRFWRTLCLNYERVRADDQKPFRKKNINLKFSRMLTIFGTVLPLISEESLKDNFISEIAKKSPMERFSIGLDNISDLSLMDGFERFLVAYEKFLTMKETLKGMIDVEKGIKDNINEEAKIFSGFIHDCLQHTNIKDEYRKYLLI